MNKLSEKDVNLTSSSKKTSPIQAGEDVTTRERTEYVANKIKFLLRLEFLHDKYCLGFSDEQDYKKSFLIFLDYEEQQVFKCVGVYYGGEEVIKKVEEELRNDTYYK